MELQNLKQENPNSMFCEPEFDCCIIKIHDTGAVIYHHFEMVGLEMEMRKDEFDGDFESEKEEFTQNFKDFYDEIDEGIINLFEEMKNNPDKNSKGENMIRPILHTELGQEDLNELLGWMSKNSNDK